jgi:hypothetical protein
MLALLAFSISVIYIGAKLLNAEGLLTPYSSLLSCPSSLF